VGVFEGFSRAIVSAAKMHDYICGFTLNEMCRGPAACTSRANAMPKTTFPYSFHKAFLSLAHKLQRSRSELQHSSAARQVQGIKVCVARCSGNRTLLAVPQTQNRLHDRPGRTARPSPPQVSTTLVRSTTTPSMEKALVQNHSCHR
jgi:hypothetical protein